VDVSHHARANDRRNPAESERFHHRGENALQAVTAASYNAHLSVLNVLQHLGQPKLPKVRLAPQIIKIR
jgi:hypothetical protein